MHQLIDPITPGEPCIHWGRFFWDQFLGSFKVAVLERGLSPGGRGTCSAYDALFYKMMFGPTRYATIALLLEKNILIFVAGELARFSPWQPHLLSRGLNMFHKSWNLKSLCQLHILLKDQNNVLKKGFSLVPISSRTRLSSTTAGICKFFLTITALFQKVGQKGTAI